MPDFNPTAAKRDLSAQFASPIVHYKRGRHPVNEKVYIFPEFVQFVHFCRAPHLDQQSDFLRAKAIALLCATLLKLLQPRPVA
jgi:hypothetical protein